jgi:hypothetical protein
MYKHPRAGYCVSQLAQFFGGRLAETAVNSPVSRWNSAIRACSVRIQIENFVAKCLLLLEDFDERPRRSGLALGYGPTGPQAGDAWWLFPSRFGS